MFGRKNYSLGERRVLHRSFYLWKETTANAKLDLNFRVHLLLPLVDGEREESNNGSLWSRPLVSGRNPRTPSSFCESRDTPGASSCVSGQQLHPRRNQKPCFPWEISPKPEGLYSNPNITKSLTSDRPLGRGRAGRCAPLLYKGDMVMLPNS